MRQANQHQDQLAKWSNKIKAKQLYNNDILITVSAYEFPNMEQKYDMMQMLYTRQCNYPKPDSVHCIPSMKSEVARIGIIIDTCFTTSSSLLYK